MKKIAVFPGSFDPITIGHVDVILRGLPLFDEIIIGIGNNSKKSYLFPLEKRKRLIEKIFEKNDKISVHAYQGLTVNFCKEMNANYLLRGLRSSTDFEFEKTIAHLNKSMEPEMETVFLVSRSELSHINSTIVREIYMHGGDISKFIHSAIADDVSPV